MLVAAGLGVLLVSGAVFASHIEQFFLKKYYFQFEGQNRGLGFMIDPLDDMPDVSRSFAVIIPKCPPPLDRALSVGYLICRVADTIEDDVSLSDDARSTLYDALLSAVDEPAQTARASAVRTAWPALPQGPYGELIEGFDRVLVAYATLPATIPDPRAILTQKLI